jgi:hypothetical protein
MPTNNVWSCSFALSLYFGRNGPGAPAEPIRLGTNGSSESTSSRPMTPRPGIGNPTSCSSAARIPRARDDLSVVRLNADGTPDASFAIGGRTAFDVAGFYGRTFSVLAQSDGKVLAGGLITPDGPSGLSDRLAVARFLTDGRIDTSFGDAGVASVDFDCCLGTERASAAATKRRQDRTRHGRV